MNDRDTLKQFMEHKSKHGLKSSDKRSFIVGYFVKADRHFTVEELYDEIKRSQPEISYSTVYRALKLLVHCGLAAKCTFDESAQRGSILREANQRATNSLRSNNLLLFL